MTARAPARRGRSARQVELLDRLVEVVTSEGFAHLTLDEVAERLRCSKATLYALAGSKQELVVEVVRRWFEVSAEVVEAAVASHDEPLARVTAYLDAVSARLGLLSREFADDLTRNAAAAELYRRNTDRAADRIRALIAEGIERGAFRAVNASFTAETVAAVMLQIQRGEMGARLGLDDAAAYAELSTLVVQLLEPRP